VVSRRFRRNSIIISVLALLAVAAFAGHAVWLRALAETLVRDEGPAKAEIAVVLGGDYSGQRIISAAELVRQGWVPLVMVSGPPGFYGLNEADAAIRFGVARGYPADYFVALRHSAMSTREEAPVILEALRARHIHSFLLVTSDYHTARARRIFLDTERRMGGGPAMRVVAAPNENFSLTAWWQRREGRKTVFLEWTKTVTGAFGI
jgi:uncharacterized SAM-binding protein YcdF (DUF218 family)